MQCFEFKVWGLVPIEPGAFCIEVEGKLIVLEQPGDRSRNKTSRLVVANIALDPGEGRNQVLRCCLNHSIVLYSTV